MIVVVVVVGATVVVVGATVVVVVTPQLLSITICINCFRVTIGSPQASTKHLKSKPHPEIFISPSNPVSKFVMLALFEIISVACCSKAAGTCILLLTSNGYVIPLPIKLVKSTLVYRVSINSYCSASISSMVLTFPESNDDNVGM